jgi:hypothetical protein
MSVCMKMNATLTEIRIWYDVYRFFSRLSAVSSSASSVGCAAITSMEMRSKRETTTSTSDA